MTARNASAMTPEERAAKVDALKPAWAKDYIRQLEDLTRALAQRVGPGSPEPGPARAECELHQPVPRPGCATCETMSLQEWKDRYARHAGQQADTQLIQPDGSVVSTSVIPGITPPGDEYAVVRVLDGAANMEPVADLPDKAEIRFADFYQVHYGSGEDTGGARVLIVETNQPMAIRPVAPCRLIITRAG